MIYASTAAAAVISRYHLPQLFKDAGQLCRQDRVKRLVVGGFPGNGRAAVDG